MLPPWDEGAGEVWARSQSEDIRSHCERVRPGGGRGALPGTLLWLECQVRQDPGNSLCITKDPISSLTLMSVSAFSSPNFKASFFQCGVYRVLVWPFGG